MACGIEKYLQSFSKGVSVGRDRIRGGLIPRRTLQTPGRTLFEPCRVLSSRLGAEKRRGRGRWREREREVEIEREREVEWRKRLFAQLRFVLNLYISLGYPKKKKEEQRVVII